MGDLILSRLEPDASRVERGDWSDLGARIASSLVLAGGGVAAAWFGGPWLAAACGAAVVAMSYEWARMSEPEGHTAAFLFALAGSLGAVMFASWGHLSWSAGWMAACAVISGFRRRTLAGFVETAGGALYVGLPCALFLWPRDRAPEGLETILSLFAMIWAADVCAYFGGKVIGGPKVAEGLSPNKTWSGIVAGALAGVAAGWLCGAMVGAEGLRLQVWMGVGGLIAFTGLMGDLFESFLKRRFGVKDASKLIPGHGGVLDRIDGLMAATLLTGAAMGGLAWLFGVADRGRAVSADGRTISILGVTGSIGQSTIQVIEELRGRGVNLPVEAITAGGNLAGLADACRRLKPRFAAVADASQLEEARAALAGLDVSVGAGPSALEEAGARPADWVMSAIVGAAGLSPTMAAVRRGAHVALANKECLVCAGPLFIEAARAHGATLLPVDSEHNAMFQVLTHPERVERLTLTASGGPFRTWTREQMAVATPAQACAHPMWSMGRKISVDSATLMNKGLELIEASYLFGVAGDLIDIIVHPQSTIHSLVHYVDGSVLAQMATPDMRIPIAYALAWPDRAAVSTARLDLAKVAQLTFEAPDPVRFPALKLARDALKRGAPATTALSAANEIAVEAFLAGRIGFLDIARITEEVLAHLEGAEAGLIAKTPSSFDEVAAVDGAARRAARRIAGSLAAA